MRLLPVLDFGGVESRVVLQSQLIDRERFEFRVCTFWKDGAAADRLRRHGMAVDALDVDPAVRNVRATSALTRYLRRVRPDVLHASIVEANFHAAVAGELARVPVRIVEEVGIPERSELGQAVFGLLFQLADAVVGVTEKTCDIVYSEGAPADRIHLVYNCANPDFFEEEFVRTPHNRQLRVLAVGRLVPVKNHLRLLEVFRLVVDEAPGVTLRIAGEGPLRAEMQRRIGELGLEENVRLLGFRNDVKALLHESDVFVLPSVSEGCSISLIEAMATGICPIGSTADGIREVMGEVGDEWLVPHEQVDGWADALLRVARMTPTERVALGERARRIAFERFSPRVYDETVSRLYLELARKRGIDVGEVAR